MRLFHLSLLIASALACGRKTSSTPAPPSSQDATPAAPATATPAVQGAATGVSATPGPAGPVGPAGPAGQNGAAGDKGEKGDTGAQGAQGSKGAVGAPGGIQLFDATNHAVANKLNDDNGSIASVIFFDGKQGLVDRVTGALQPFMSFFCMYTSADCTGTCNIYDSRWHDVIVADTAGHTWLAARTTASGTALVMHSYVAADLSCTVNTISTPASYATTAYTLPGLSFPLAAPLYWGIPH